MLETCYLNDVSSTSGMLNNLSQKITSFVQNKIKFYFVLCINLYPVINLSYVQIITFENLMLANQDHQKNRL